MAKTKYKLGQTLETADQFGKVKEIHIAEDGVKYILADDGEVKENDVTAVYRAVKPRESKPRASKPRNAAKPSKNGKAQTENRAAA